MNGYPKLTERRTEEDDPSARLNGAERTPLDRKHKRSLNSAGKEEGTPAQQSKPGLILSKVTAPAAHTSLPRPDRAAS